MLSVERGLFSLQSFAWIDGVFTLAAISGAQNKIAGIVTLGWNCKKE
jgi:hypothetical protein